MSRNKKLQTKRNKAQKRNRRKAEHRRNRTHTCGKCRACCYVFPLPGKPQHCWCSHSAANGCGCYESRPTLCREYKCGYLIDAFCPPSWRPDLCGIVISRSKSFRGHPVLALVEYRAGAFGTIAGQNVIQGMNNNAILVLYPFDNTGPLFSYKHTGLILTEAGQRELQNWVLTTVQENGIKNWAEPFNFGTASADVSATELQSA